jgi:hypothetical protein
MDEVRQAHLPGNYELYDEVSNRLGPPICKLCWENAHQPNSASLHTVWLTVDGWNVAWWLCSGHQKRLGSVEAPSTRILRSEDSVVRSPGVQG